MGSLHTLKYLDTRNKQIKHMDKQSIAVIQKSIDMKKESIDVIKYLKALVLWPVHPIMMPHKTNLIISRSSSSRSISYLCC